MTRDSVRNVECFQFNFQELASEEMGKMVGLTDPKEMMELWNPFYDRIFEPRREEAIRFVKVR